jgi:hypothetical protein
MLHILSQFSSVFSKSFHFSTCFHSIFFVFFLPHDGLCDFQSTTVDINQNPSDIILQRIEDECNGLPRDTFISNLIKLCNNDTESLEQLRLQYFIITKNKMDFPFPSAVLKKIIHPKAKTGEPLINKLGRDCFLLRLASKGE